MRFKNIEPKITNINTSKYGDAALQHLLGLDRVYQDSYDKLLAEIEAESILKHYQPDIQDFVPENGWAYYSREVTEDVIRTIHGEKCLFDIGVENSTNEMCSTIPSGYYISNQNAYKATHRELTNKEKTFLAEARERDRELYLHENTNYTKKDKTMKTITKNFFLKETMLPKQVKEGKTINVDKEVYDEIDTRQNVAFGDTQKENKFRLWLEYEIDRLAFGDGWGPRDSIDYDSFMPDNFVFYKEAYARAAIHVMYGWDNTYDFDDPNEAALKKDGIYFVMAEHYYNPTRNKLTPTVAEIIQSLLELDNLTKDRK